MARFEPVDPKVDFPAMERRILEFWRANRIFERSMEQRQGADEWVFYDGPPTANGRPHIGHVEARTFKDIYPRFRTMTGRYVRRKAGWDCHGLPVELEVEKEIGTKTKRDIEAFGIARFNQLCRESVVRYVDEWRRMSERIGFWIDMDDPYWTMDPQYVESVWWSLKCLFDQGLLFQDHKSVAYCPRCGTGLSDHEVALGYHHVVDPSVYVRFRITEPSAPELEGASILAWTTTPWTLPSNEGLAVDEAQPYAVVTADGERLVVAASLKDVVLGEDAEIAHTLPGSALIGTRYEPLYENVNGDTHRVVGGDFVVMNEGTGVVHIAPGYGADDLEVGRREGWPIFNPVDDQGKFTDQVPEFVRGLFVKDADPLITEDLRARGLLLRAEDYEHTYPLCWRCSTPLLYMARTSWYIRTTARKDRLLEVNEEVDWYPPHIRHGRYGDWLENNVDWALSRERYWGTPLPLWRCADGHVTAVGSRRELSERAGRDVTAVDPHRPDIDEVMFACPECGEEARRVPEVIDTWYDSGAMPYAQWGYHPDLGRGVEQFERRFPADFIAEGIDQTRGWFYSLMAEGVLLFDSTAYRNVVCHGLVVDREGRKMSKSVGNVIEPMELLDAYGADAVRWFLVVGGSPWADRRVFPEALAEVVRQFLLTLWNVHSFFTTYASVDGFDPATAPAPPVGERPAIDRWILSQLAGTVHEARAGLEAFDATAAGRRIQRFVDDLSNWYIRRSRRRFWDPARLGGDRADGSADKGSAYHTLYECLSTLARLLAPITPFVSEEVWRGLCANGDGAPESVHLADYPEPAPDVVDPSLDAAMEAVRTIVSLGRTIRTDARVRIRQPLTRAVVHYAGEHGALLPLLDLVSAELNVKEVAFAESAEQLGRWQAKPNFKVLGPRLGPRVKEVAAWLERDDGSLAASLARGEQVGLEETQGAPSIEIGPEDVNLTQETLEGWGVAAEGGVTVALDLDLTPDLRLEGLAREVVRLVQDARKAAGLDVTDRIALGLEAEGDLAEAIGRHRDTIAAETLAVEVTKSAVADPLFDQESAVEGTTVRVSLAKRAGDQSSP
ncbi:MAG: isoleucine--tRNA ligase [Actinomycetota bacterium]